MNEEEAITFYKKWESLNTLITTNLSYHDAPLRTGSILTNIHSLTEVTASVREIGAKEGVGLTYNGGSKGKKAYYSCERGMKYR
tara:strand:+ start:245 stop:496 length:252 start_codon:yes stop_codon:yes gene_type:complete